MPKYAKEYSWQEVKRLIADSEARPSPYTHELATQNYLREVAQYAAAVQAYQPVKEQFEAEEKEAKARFQKELEAVKARYPGQKPPKNEVPAFPKLTRPPAPVPPSRPDTANFLGHASAKHHAITDQELEQRAKEIGTASAFIRGVEVAGTKVAVQDQSVLVRSVLNSKLGQAALQALDQVPAPARLTITQVDALSIKMRVAKDNQQQNVAIPVMRQVVLIVDSGANTLHVVTCYPVDILPSGPRMGADSSYSLSYLQDGKAKEGSKVRWSVQTDQMIPEAAQSLW